MGRLPDPPLPSIFQHHTELHHHYRVTRPQDSLCHSAHCFPPTQGFPLLSSGRQGSGPLMGPLTSFSQPQQPLSQRAHSQQVVLELVRPNIIEDLCKLLFTVADEEGRMQEDAIPSTQQQGDADGVAEAAAAAGAEEAAAKLLAQQERVVLEEFSSILGKVAETALKRAAERQGGGAAASTAVTQQQQQPGDAAAGVGKGPAGHGQLLQALSAGIAGAGASGPQQGGAFAAAAAAMMQAIQQIGAAGGGGGGPGLQLSQLPHMGQQTPLKLQQQQVALSQLQAAFAMRQQQGGNGNPTG